MFQSILTVNFDSENGIHYGVISQHTPDSWIWDDFSPVYETECPACGTVTRESECPSCGADFSDANYDEASYWEYTGGDGYELDYSESLSAFFVLKSPFYTFAALCSPCAPNAGDLDTPAGIGRGVRAYCLGHDFFDNGVAPYVVYDVKTDAIVYSDKSGLNPAP